MTARKHELIQHGPKSYECRVCAQTWKSRPQTKCPGLRVYPSSDYAPLLTQQQLGYMGYQNTTKALPAPVGCYYAKGIGIYVDLYDPAHATKRKAPARRRVTTSVTEIFWPQNGLYLLERFVAVLDNRPMYQNPEYQMLVNEIANITAAVIHFTREEIEHYGQGCLPLTISPSLVHAHYRLFSTHEDEQMALIKRVATAYRKQQEQP